MSIAEENPFSIVSITIHPNATKHSRKYGPEIPVSSELVKKEIEERFRDNMDLRIGDKFHVQSLSNCPGYYLQVMSTTSDGMFIETGSDIGMYGTCTVKHFFPHEDKERFIKELDKINSFDGYLIFKGFD